jgi:hypothetical protein
MATSVTRTVYQPSAQLSPVAGSQLASQNFLKDCPTSTCARSVTACQKRLRNGEAPRASANVRSVSGQLTAAALFSVNLRARKTLNVSCHISIGFGIAQHDAKAVTKLQSTVRVIWILKLCKTTDHSLANDSKGFHV